MAQRIESSAQSSRAAVPPINVFEYEEAAHPVLAPADYDYIAGGATDEVTLRRTRDAFDELELRPRILQGVRDVSFSTTALGTPVNFPVFLAPAGGHKKSHPDGEIATAKAAGAIGSLVAVSAHSSYSLEEISAAAPTTPLWCQIYFYKDRAMTLEWVRRAEATGCKAICITADAVWPPKRERVIRRRMQAAQAEGGNGQASDPPPPNSRSAAGDLARAHQHYLEAAKLLFAEARDSSSARLRQQRYEQGQQVMERAKAVAALMEDRRQQQTEARGQAARISADSDETPDWLLAERPDLSLDDVAGLDDAKEQIHLKLIYPFTHPDQARRFGVRPGGGILLYGPPGTGKTYLARAVAGELDAAFFVAKASDLMSQWFGKAEQNIAALFNAARRHERSVIFLDEVEALVPRRRGTSSSVMPRVVSEFLSQTQGLDESGGAVLLIGATNEPWAIDPAALRPGRFGELIYVGLPGFDARRRILELNLRDRPLSLDVDVDELATRLDGYSGADIAYLCRKAGERAFLDAIERGVGRDIQLADFDAILAARAPSVTREQVKKYEQFQEKRSAVS